MLIRTTMLIRWLWKIPAFSAKLTKRLACCSKNSRAMVSKKPLEKLGENQWKVAIKNNVCASPLYKKKFTLHIEISSSAQVVFSSALMRRQASEWDGTKRSTRNVWMKCASEMRLCERFTIHRRGTQEMCIGRRRVVKMFFSFTGITTNTGDSSLLRRSGFCALDYPAKFITQFNLPSPKWSRMRDFFRRNFENFV